jgi:branched-chain amino acid transport system substrate-binding protein
MLVGGLISSCNKKEQKPAEGDTAAGAATSAAAVSTAAAAPAPTPATPTSTTSVTDYAQYVKGKPGKADPSKGKVHIGWVNQEGGQVVIGELATAGARLAVQYVNDELGGIGGQQVELVECFIKSSEEEGTTCGQKLVNDEKVAVIATGAVATGAQSFFATVRGAKPVVSGVAVTPIDGAQKNAIVLFGDAPHILLPFGNYAKNVLKAKTAAVIYPNAPGVAESGQIIAGGLKKNGIEVKQVGYTQGQSALTGPLVASGAPKADFIAPYGTASDCANQAKALLQLKLTDSKKIMTAPLCLNKQVSAALGDWPLWTYAIASSLFGDASDEGMPAYQAVIKTYKAEKNAPDPWHIVAFSELLTTIRFLNEANEAGKISPDAVLARAKAFTGPLALGAPKIQCGKYPDAPGICNDMFQAFTYQGKFKFERASGWIGP